MKKMILFVLLLVLMFPIRVYADEITLGFSKEFPTGSSESDYYVVVRDEQNGKGGNLGVGYVMLEDSTKVLFIGAQYMNDTEQNIKMLQFVWDGTDFRVVSGSGSKYDGTHGSSISKVTGHDGYLTRECPYPTLNGIMLRNGCIDIRDEFGMNTTASMSLSDTNRCVLDLISNNGESDIRFPFVVGNTIKNVSIEQVLMDYAKTKCVDSTLNIEALKGEAEWYKAAKHYMDRNSHDDFSSYDKQIRETKDNKKLYDIIFNGSQTYSQQLRSLLMALGDADVLSGSDLEEVVSRLEPDASDNGEENILSWKNWYMAALCIASGVSIDESPLKDHYIIGTDECLYSSFDNLMQFDMNETDKRYLYEVICISALNGVNEEWFSGYDFETELSNAFDCDIGTRGNLDYTVLSGLVSTIQDNYNSSDQTMKRFSTIRERLEALLIMMGSDGSIDMSWIEDWYSSYPQDWFVDGDMISDQMIPVLAQYKFSSNSKLGYYAIRTLYEIPYLVKYYITELNEQTVINRDLYKAVRGIKDAKDSLGLPVLNYIWNYHVPVDGDSQLTSLSDIWESMKKLDTVESDEPLESGKPLKSFFQDLSKLSDKYIQGLAYTSTLVPMRTNLYSDEWLTYMSPEFYRNFYYLWGFNRKALYRDKTTGAAESYFTSGKGNYGNLEICTLRDLVESKEDVVLYLDDNFYNVDDMRSRIESRDIEPENELPWWTFMASKIEEAYTTDFEKIVKTGASTNYSKTFYDMMTKIEGSHTYYPEATIENVGNTDNIVLSSGRINYYLNSGNAGSEVYSPMQGYAVVSAIYRDIDLFNKANSREVQEPVFIASETAPFMKNASIEACLTIFNYAIMRNLKEAMPIDYAGNIDMDCPIYMDILGNIVTESGTIVIPAMSNPTIHNSSSYYKNMWSAGLFTVYGLDYKIPVKDNMPSNLKTVLSEAFIEEGDYYMPQARILGDVYKIDMSRLSTTSKGTLDTLYQMSYALLHNSALYNFDSYFQIALEVLRGAPIESIDKVAEGIDTTHRIDKAGIMAAAKLEELNEALSSHTVNTILRIPSLSFMPGFNYVVIMVFKVMLLIIIIVNMVTIYFDAVGSQLGIHTLWKCIMAIGITLITIVTVPAVFETTYYQSNRFLLQDEAVRIAMLNQEKEVSGVEIGVTSVGEPEIGTDLYVKLEDVRIPWHNLIYDSMFTNSYVELNKLYANYVEDNLAVAHQPDVIVKNDGVYVDVRDIYNSSSIDVDQSAIVSDKWLLQQTALDSENTFSFYSPYYAILDALIRNVNYFNENPRNDDDLTVGGWYSYTMKELKGGKIKTMGIIEPYLTSDRFVTIAGTDPLGLRELYGTTYEVDPATDGMYSTDNLKRMHDSAWFPRSMSDSEISKRIDYMTDKARRFVAKNRDLIGKISDDTFLKSMALSLAIEHNKIFGVESASSFEIYNLSHDDLIRLSIADSKEVMVNSTLSYARFVYVVGGSVSVFASAILSMIMWVCGIVKPLLVIMAFIVIFISIFVFRVCMNKEGASLYGYMITVFLLAGTNICYSIMLKLSLFFPTLGLTPLMCIILQIVLQLGYMVLLSNIVLLVFKDWKDLGYTLYAHKFQDMRVGAFNMFHSKKVNPFYGGTTKISTPENNWKFYNDMMEEHQRRYNG